MDNDKVESLDEKEKELMSEIQDMPHAELVSEFMDLHAAFIATEQRAAMLQGILEEIHMMTAEAFEE